MPMRCPHCGSVVEPLRDASGALVCPACQNTGRILQATPPAQAAFAPPQFQPVPAPPTGPPGPTPGRAIASLVLGVCAIVLFPIGLILGPMAIVYSVKAKNELRRAPPGTPGEGMAMTGLVLGIIGIVVGLIGGLVLMSAVVFVLVSNLGEPPGTGPEVGFRKDDSGPGGMLTVLATEAGLQWSAFSSEGTADCVLPVGEVQVGDVVDCPSPGTFELYHPESGDVVYATSFD